MCFGLRSTTQLIIILIVIISISKYKIISLLENKKQKDSVCTGVVQTHTTNIVKCCFLLAQLSLEKLEKRRRRSEKEQKGFVAKFAPARAAPARAAPARRRRPTGPLQRLFSELEVVVGFSGSESEGNCLKEGEP